MMTKQNILRLLRLYHLRHGRLILLSVCLKSGAVKVVIRKPSEGWSGLWLLYRRPEEDTPVVAPLDNLDETLDRAAEVLFQCQLDGDKILAMVPGKIGSITGSAKEDAMAGVAQEQTEDEDRQMSLF